jgi:hypothetical protein
MRRVGSGHAHITLCDLSERPAYVMQENSGWDANVSMSHSVCTPPTQYHTIYVPTSRARHLRLPGGPWRSSTCVMRGVQGGIQA